MPYHHQTWTNHRGDGYLAVALMLEQYVGDFGGSERLARRLESSPSEMRSFIQIESSALETLARLSGEKANWFRTVASLAVLSRTHLKNFENHSDADLWHDFVTAGEFALTELERYGFVSCSWGGGSWTKEGRALLAGKAEV